MMVCRKRGTSGQGKIQYIKYLHCQLESNNNPENAHLTLILKGLFGAYLE